MHNVNRLAPIGSLLLAVLLLLSAAACGDDTGNGVPDAGSDVGIIDASIDAAADADADGSVDPRFAPLIAVIEQERQELAAAGVAVAVLEQGEVTFTAGFGSKHPEQDDPVLPTTLFRIGSLTKMLTATGVLQLVEQGTVSLDASLIDYVPEFDFTADTTWAPFQTTFILDAQGDSRYFRTRPFVGRR